MTSIDIYNFKPTFLYIKQHTKTGKLYFGKTVQNPEKYYGSGTHWVNHIEKHGKEYVANLWYCLFLDKQDCVDFASSFSEKHNITESEDWLNQQDENGLGGSVPGRPGAFTGKHHSEKFKTDLRIRRTGVRESAATCKKISLAKTGLVASPETREKMSRARLGKILGPRSDQEKANISRSKIGKKRPTKECAHCGIVANVSNITRWHGDKCKHAKQYS